jgi:hypothetical protein
MSLNNLGRWLGRLATLMPLFALSLEITTRIEEWVRFRTPLLTRYRSQFDLIVRDEHGTHGRPNSRFQKWEMNSLGLRGPEVSLAKAPGVYRIATLGASETFGLYESPDHEFPRQLQKILNRDVRRGRLCGSSIRKVEVLNAALPGMSLPTSIQNLSGRLNQYGLDMVVVYPSPPQYLGNDGPRSALPDWFGAEGELPWVRDLEPRVLWRLSSQIKRLAPDAARRWLRERERTARLRAYPRGWLFETIPVDRLEAFESDLRQLVGTTRAVGAIPVLVTHANAFHTARPLHPDYLRALEKYFPRATGSTMLAFDSAAAEVTRTVAADSAAILVDGRDVLSGSREALFADFDHFTDRGASVFAGAVAQRLREAMGCKQVL